MNRIIENNYKSAAPEVGMGATELGYSDRHPYTVTWVDPNGKRAFVQHDKAVRTDNYGMSDMQSYDYIRQPLTENIPIKFYAKDGHWHMFCNNRKGNVIMLGRREKYYDYSF